MVAPTYTFLGFNYSMQNLPHHRTADFERRKEWSVYYKFRRNLFKHGISFDVTARTQAPKQSTGLFLFASQIALFEPRMILYKKERYHKWYLSFFMERMTRLELATSTLARLRSTGWATSANVVLPDGIEPSTRGFSVPCSTDWATEAQMATRNGFEPSTSSVTG